jgi:hypothetical protein
MSAIGAFFNSTWIDICTLIFALLTMWVRVGVRPYLQLPPPPPITRAALILDVLNTAALFPSLLVVLSAFSDVILNEVARGPRLIFAVDGMIAVIFIVFEMLG